MEAKQIQTWEILLMAEQGKKRKQKNTELPRQVYDTHSMSMFLNKETKRGEVEEAYSAIRRERERDRERERESGREEEEICWERKKERKKSGSDENTEIWNRWE